MKQSRDGVQREAQPINKEINRDTRITRKKMTDRGKWKKILI